VFGWRGDALQRAMDTNCDACTGELRSQSIATGNQCVQQQKVREDVDGPFTALPGNVEITGPQPAVSNPGSANGNGMFSGRGRERQSDRLTRHDRQPYYPN